MSPRCVCRVLAVGIASAMILLAPPSIRAQGRGNAAPARTAQQAAPIDLTGYWVSFVTEDWRFRMGTPAKAACPGAGFSGWISGVRLVSSSETSIRPAPDTNDGPRSVSRSE